MADALQPAAPIDPSYPIGRYRRPESIDAEARSGAITAIADLPEQMRNALAGLDDAKLDTPYREGGWTVRQLVHHVADSHMHAFNRVRRALTENAPTIYGYDEKIWATLNDSRTAPAEWSLTLIEGLHARWVMLLQSLDEAAWQRPFVHSERGPMTIEQATLLYGWHSRHHLAHITHLRAAKGW